MVTYRDEMTKEKQDEVDGRAQTLMRHSVMSYVDEVSEATWEADVRNTVFGSIRDDLRLRMFDPIFCSFLELSANVPCIVTNAHTNLLTRARGAGKSW